MHAQTIVNRIVDLKKDQNPGEVAELLASKANVADLSFIADRLEAHHTKELSAVNEALDWISKNAPAHFKAWGAPDAL